ncbi:signal recognition particle-docking protein FtsY [Anaeromicrobium sediminis]|uniref:Signal recognition particle receptor FtsY n=1 Tax=Anaeromicrobium sediminis TaxID=1478221 RepID=A0A267MHF5_9FIRM|nr:signal recognition particle-docking protein FtsY [Anaeromicrobium sediminis]PAB58897.1 signal recognition particle-docking protein FtsY [Anaeromicrobium sediminis]
MLKGIFSKFKKNEESKEINNPEEIQDTKEVIEEEQQVEEKSEEIIETEEVAMDMASDMKEEVASPKAGLFEKLKMGLSKTRNGIVDKVDSVLKAYKKVDEELFEELEEILITSDAGVNTTMEIIDRLRTESKKRKITESEELRYLIKEILIDILTLEESNELNVSNSPSVILVVGVNGVGKTTSIGKIAHRMKGEGKKVILAAGDTFRAAAIDQLEIWSNRVGVDIIKHQEGADTAAVIFDAIQSAKSKNTDILICDTAGRLHNKKNLMNELGKVSKVLEREFSEAAKETLLVLDATTGQNAIQQAKVFKEVTNINGVVLTKLDGTAKGGVVLSIANELNIPVKLIGVGEGMEDLQLFNPNDFVNALFGE